MSLNVERAIRSVFTLHDQIEAVFSQADVDATLAELLAYFSSNFEMITIKGQRIQYPQLQALFTNNMGAWPDFKIEISEVMVIAEAADHVLLRYQEQQVKQGVATLRQSTALIEFQGEHCLWRYLHETTV